MRESNKNILVTGGKGFIGSHLCRLLVSKGYKISIYDLEDGNDIRDFFKLNKSFRDNNFDTVIHMAARAGVRTSKEFPEEYISTNIQGTNNVIRCAEQYNVKVIFFSSSSVFGSQKPPNNEYTPIKPESLYAVTKATGEMLCKSSKVKTIIVRPFTVYGENGRKDQLIFKWLECYKTGKTPIFFGNGKTKRGYTYVGDLVKAIVNILLLPDTQWPDSFNIGGNQVTTLSDVLDIFKKVIPDFNVDYEELQDGDVAENYAETLRAENLLNLTFTDFESKVEDIIKSEIKS